MFFVVVDFGVGDKSRDSLESLYNVFHKYWTILENMQSYYYLENLKEIFFFKLKEFIYKVLFFGHCSIISINSEQYSLILINLSILTLRDQILLKYSIQSHNY